MACPSLTEATTPGTGCCKTLTSIRRWASSRHDNFYDRGCFHKRASGSSTRTPMHGTGRALDIGLKKATVPANNEAMWALVNGMVSVYCSLGVQRIKFDRKYWDVSMGNTVVGPDGWGSLSALQIKREGTYVDHAHVEVSTEHCDTLSLEDVQRLFPTLVIPGGNNEGVTLPAPTDPPTAPTQPSLALSDTSGKWTRDQILAACSDSVGLLEDDLIVFIICGGRGGYVINKTNGTICAAGLATHHGNFTGAVLDFIPYGDGYYALMSDGLTVTGLGPDAAALTIDCLDSGPWDNISSPESGMIVLSRVDSRLNIIQCAIETTDLATDASYTGPCC